MSEHKNQEGIWTKDDCERNAYERLSKRHSAEVKSHLCERGRQVFEDYEKLIGGELDRLHRELLALRETPPQEAASAPESDEPTPV